MMRQPRESPLTRIERLEFVNKGLVLALVALIAGTLFEAGINRNGVHAASPPPVQRQVVMSTQPMATSIPVTNVSTFRQRKILAHHSKPLKHGRHHNDAIDQWNVFRRIVDTFANVSRDDSSETD